MEGSEECGVERSGSVYDDVHEHQRRATASG
jgi:hypothetical protein